MKKIILSILILLLTVIAFGYNFFPNNNMIVYAEEPTEYSFDISTKLNSSSEYVEYGWFYVGTGSSKINDASCLSSYNNQTVTLITRILFSRYYQGVYVDDYAIDFENTYLFKYNINTSSMGVVSCYNTTKFKVNNNVSGGVSLIKTVSFNNIDELRVKQKVSNYNFVIFSNDDFVYFGANTNALDFKSFSSGGSFSTVNTSYICYGSGIIYTYDYSLQIYPSTKEGSVKLYQNEVLVYSGDLVNGLYNNSVVSGAYDVKVLIDDTNFNDLEFELILSEDTSQVKELTLSVSEFTFFMTEFFGFQSTFGTILNNSVKLMFNDLAIWGVGIGWYIVSLIFVLFLFHKLFKGGN